MEKIMVAAGFKAGTEKSISADKFDQEEFDKERDTYAKLGLVLSPVKYSEFQSDRGVTKDYSYYLYNPETLMAQTRDSELVPFTKDMTIEQWFDLNAQNGKPSAYVIGKFYSYPESEIKEFHSIQDFDSAFASGEYATSQDSFPLEYGDGDNDGFVFKVPASSEVIKREADKSILFQLWAQDPQIASMLNSGIIEDSRSLFWGN